MADVPTDSSGLSPVLVALRTCFLVVLTLMIIGGNILSIAVTRRVNSLADSTKVLMTVLAASDLLVGLLSPLFVVASAMDRWPFGTTGCILVYCCFQSLIGVSMFSLIGLNIDRYIAITRPYKFPVWCSKQHTIIYVVAESTLAVVWSTVTQILGKNIQYYQTSAMCFNGYQGVVSILKIVMVLAIPTLVLIPIYYRIIRISRQHELRNNPNEGNRVQDNKALKVFLMVTVTFVICFSPIVLLRVVENIPDWTSPHWFQFLAKWLMVANSALNVFIYCLYNQAYRQAAKKLIQERILLAPGCCKHSAVGPVNI